ncbi:MAG: hypothetical protein VSS75_013225, partial [Candidatus Parabeggiatoa sp.]|nr:hypothetical protein [Candidatus Parabeggiatoa sp.]
KAVVQPVTVRAKDITSNGFAAALFEEETRNDGHPTETVGYVAIYSATGSGTLTTAGQAIDYQVQQIQLESLTSQAGLRLEEEYSLDDETNHVTESVDILTLGDHTFAQIVSFNEADTVTVREGFSTPTDDKQLGEQDVVEVTHNWQSTSLTGEYQNPVIIAGPASSNDLEPGVVRLQQVTPSSFEMRFQEWYYLDQKHAQETLPYVVMEAGRYPMSDGSLWEVGHFTVSGTAQWKDIHFGQAFPGQPRLFLTLQTSKAVVQPVTVRAKDITSNGFAAALFEEETRNDGHPTETVGYVAIYSATDTGTVTLGGQMIDYQLQQIELESLTTQAGLRLEEEYSLDDETNHVTETVDILTLGDQTFAQIVSFNEADTVTLRHTQQTRQGDRTEAMKPVGFATLYPPYKTTISFESHGLEIDNTGQQNNSLAYFIGTLTKSTLDLLIYPAPQHIGQSADQLIWVEQHGQTTIYYLDNQSKWQRWDGQIEQLPATSTYDALPILVQESFNPTHLSLTGEIKLYLGYRLSNGSIIYNEF